MTENKPPLFTDKSLRIFTRILVIYAIFYIVVVVAKSLSDPLSEQVKAPSNGYLPSYVMAAVHFVLLLPNVAMIITKRYNWVVPSISAIIMLLCRIYFQDLSLWIWSW